MEKNSGFKTCSFIFNMIWIRFNKLEQLINPVSSIAKPRRFEAKLRQAVSDGIKIKKLFKIPPMVFILYYIYFGIGKDCLRIKSRHWSSKAGLDKCVFLVQPVSYGDHYGWYDDLLHSEISSPQEEAHHSFYLSLLCYTPASNTFRRLELDMSSLPLASLFSGF